MTSGQPTAVTPLVTFEPMKWWHLEDVVDCELEVFDDPWSAEMYWSELAQPSRHYVVASSDGELLGYAGLGIFDGEGHVQTIAVVPGRRRTGLGRQLLLALLRQAVALEVPSMLLEVRTDNANAQALYRSVGFVEVGIRRGYYQPSGADAAVMRLHSPSAGIAALEASLA